MSILHQADHVALLFDRFGLECGERIAALALKDDSGNAITLSLQDYCKTFAAAYNAEYGPVYTIVWRREPSNERFSLFHSLTSIP